MDFYTFVDITPQLFNDKLNIIPGIDYVYTDKTGTVVKKENMGKEEESITDSSVKTVHLILEKGKQLYDVNQVSYHDIDEVNCSLQTMRNNLINVLEGRGPSITDDTMMFEVGTPNQSTTNLLSQTSKKSPDIPLLPITKSSSRPLSAQSTPRTGNIARQPLFPNRQPGWNTPRRPLSDTSAEPTPRLTDEEQARLLDPSKLPEKTSKNDSNNIAAKNFANKYNRGTKPDDRVKALKNVKKEDQSAVLNLFTDKEPSKGKGGLPERHVVESHFNHFNHLANEGSRPPSGSSQQTLIKPGRRALVYNSGSYKIGIVGPINRSTDQYVIDVPSGTETSYKINSEDFEDNHHIPKKFVSTWYYLLTNSTEKPRNNIFLLKEKSLTQLRTKEQSGRTRGGKKTKKVHPAKKNITRSKRR